MRIKPILAFTIAISLLASCEVSDIGGGSSAPTYADSSADTIGTKNTTEGLTGLMARSDLFSSSAEIVNAKILLSADFSQATVYINGASAGVLAQVTPGLALYQSGDQSITGGGLDDDYYGIYYYNNSTVLGHMVAGVETRAVNLPTASATYSGLWQVVIGQMDADVGFSDFSVDFAAGTFTGALTNGAVVNATLTGVVVDNGLNGTAAFSGNYTGNTTFAATFFGPAADDLGGVLAGTVSPTGGGASESLIGNVIGSR